MSIPPPPPIAPVQLATWQASAPRCGDTFAKVIRVPAPLGHIRYGPIMEKVELTYSFTIAADGRATDIQRTGTGWVAHVEDLAPALAAARFAGAARTGCTVQFSLVSRPLADVPLDRLLGYAILSGAPDGSPVRARIDAASGDCVSPYPAPALRAFPDLKALPQVPGEVSWTATRFDIDARGRPVNLSVAASSGNAALDRAAIAALGRSRFQPGARHGCLLPLRNGAATLPAPTAPEEEALRPAGATCPKDLPFVVRPTLTIPQPWQRRSIEGWAVLAYDVAPWGAIGNVRVLAAQPAAEFGDWAQNVLRNATKATTTTGYVGCVDRVRFRIGDDSRLMLTGGME